MKAYITLILLSISTVGFSQSAYEKAILRGKAILADANTTEKFLEASNYFERIANKEQAEWLPKYYHSLSVLRAAMHTQEASEKAALIDKAQTLAEAAHQVEVHAEVLVLEGFTQMMRLTLDPATYGQTLTPVIFGLYGEALAKEPENPRALLMLGQMQYGTAQFFGTGYEEACGSIQKAYDIFEQTEHEEGYLLPTWGQGQAKAALARCSQ
ncbi:hypothetical protein [Marinoscillum furvescens]|uniref:Tetratricopeptide repeat protein n=1 Tax=Marinoscillum furvescens DSM 4134 TaxID=1122208 RepID=A0A3D9KXW1_MARFU|nr:hypothetical protein [Marinoscillum furvescens]RED92039.1 hypothetical protein C7460_1338 [Marinoscillum furvescens DSM 4134]